uniref:Uncharacterized protein n=1 Tax=Arundo donax TaxID=35708 RepID=A0A0A8YH62_ARUDO
MVFTPPVPPGLAR